METFAIVYMSLLMTIMVAFIVFAGIFAYKKIIAEIDSYKKQKENSIANNNK